MTVNEVSRRNRRVGIGLTILAIVLIIGAGFAYVSISGPSSDGRTAGGSTSEGPVAGGPIAVDTEIASPTAPPKPQPGDYKFRLTHSSLCLSERPRDASGLVYQADCAQPVPKRTLRSERDGAYRIATDHPDFGPGCASLPANDSQPGARLSDGYCGAKNAAELFQIEPVATPAPGYRLRAVHSGLCLGTLGGSTEPWAPVVQLACDPVAVSQVFQLDPLK